MAQAAIAAGASLLGGITGGKGASKAAKIQAAAYQKGIDEQRRQFDVTQQNFAPYLAAGDSALGSTLDLLGLGAGGNAGQQSAIDALKASPAFTSLFRQGQDTILQNASATGGLRGGNTGNSLANFGSDLLAQVIEQRLGNLGGLVNIGAGGVGQLGGLAQNNANSIANLLGQQGSSNATAAAAPYAALQGFISQLGGNSGGLSGLFSGNSSIIKNPTTDFSWINKIPSSGAF